ncbi:MAG: hypothetical protein KDD36_11065 [Flavobacteriales bacterium]|nr:hypothetical protein [Flavobacteriales bacterium]
MSDSAGIKDKLHLFVKAARSQKTKPSKLSQSLKIALIVLSVLLTLILIGGYMALKIFGEAFGSRCEPSNNWTVGEYNIQERTCLDWAGPRYYPLSLYKDGNKMTGSGSKIDSCNIRFTIEKDLCLNFNICTNQIKEILPNENHPIVSDLKPKTILLKETFQQEDVPVNDYLTDKLAPIRKNFKRVNSITEWEWTRIDKKDLWETTEGGETHYYYDGDTLEKIITRHFGEMGQKIMEYYLLDGRLSFIFEKYFNYNRPFYWDSTRMKENSDTEAFDFDQSEIHEDRSYFENDTLIHQIANGDCGAPFSDEYLLKEQQRLMVSFSKLVELSKGDE